MRQNTHSFCEEKTIKFPIWVVVCLNLRRLSKILTELQRKTVSKTNTISFDAIRQNGMQKHTNLSKT